LNNTKEKLIRFILDSDDKGVEIIARHIFTPHKCKCHKITPEDIANAVADVIYDMMNASPNKICTLAPLGALITVKLTDRLFKEDEE
jgi:hypothetical protein